MTQYGVEQAKNAKLTKKLRLRMVTRLKTPLEEIATNLELKKHHLNMEKMERDKKTKHKIIKFIRHFKSGGKLSLAHSYQPGLLILQQIEQS